MSKQEFTKLAFALNNKNLELPKLYTIDMVRHHNRGFSSGETMKHWICKCICSKLLYDAERPHFVEYEFKNGKVADIFDAKEFVVIEFESKLSDAKIKEKIENFTKYLVDGTLRDIFVINLVDLPDDVDGIAEILKHKLGI